MGSLINRNLQAGLIIKYKDKAKTKRIGHGLPLNRFGDPPPSRVEPVPVRFWRFANNCDSVCSIWCHRDWKAIPSSTAHDKWRLQRYIKNEMSQ